MHFLSPLFACSIFMLALSLFGCNEMVEKENVMKGIDPNDCRSLFSFRRFQEAQDCYARKLDSLPSDTSINVRVRSIINLSRSHRMQDELDSALMAIKKAYPLYEEVEGYFTHNSSTIEEPPFTFIEALSQGGFTANQLSEGTLSDSLYTKAEELYHRLITLYEGEDSVHKEYRLRTYEALGGHFSLKGWSKSAVQSFKSALNLYKDLNKSDWSREKRLLRTISYIYEYDAQYDSMKKYVDLRLSKEFNENQGDTTDEAIFCYPLYGRYYTYKHQYDSTLYYLQVADSWARKNETPRSQNILYFTSMGYGDLFQRIGDFPRAFSSYQQAITYTNNNGLKANALENLSALYLKGKDYSSVLSASRRVLNLRNLNSKLPDEQHRIIDTYLNMGMAYLETNDSDSAFISVQKANHIFPGIRSKTEITDWHEGKLFQARGYISFKNEAYSEASNFFNQAISKYKGVYGENYDLIGECYIALARSALELGNVDIAQRYIQDALRTLILSSELPLLERETRKERDVVLSFPLIASAYDLLADIIQKNFERRDKETALTQALDQYEIADQYLSRNLSRLSSENAVLSYRDSWYFLYEKAIKTAVKLWQANPSSEGLEIAYQYAEKSKAHILRQSQQDAYAKIEAGLDSISLHREKRLKQDMAFARAALLKATKDEKDSLNQVLFKNTNAYFTFVKELEQNNPRYYQLKYDVPATSIEEIRRSLRPEQAFIQYFEGDSTLYQFVIVPDTSWVRMIAKTEEFVEEVDAFQHLIAQDPNEGIGYDSAWINYQAYGYSLYETLYKPLESQLKACKDLILVPDGILMKVPASALPTQADYENVTDPPFFLNELAISYEFSGTTHISYQTQEQKNPLEILGVAPDFSKSSLQSLKRTSEGLEKIGRVISGKYLKDRAATKENVSQYLKDYGILYFATHAQMDTTAPLFSSLAFTPESLPLNPERDFLYAYEIYNDTLAAQLTILGACETGIGAYEQSEGMISLGRAFAYAGCPSLVMSLWKAQYITTSLDILPDFIQNLTENQSKGRALQKAKQNFLKKAREKEWEEEIFPYAWATFISVGNQSPIELAESDNR